MTIDNESTSNGATLTCSNPDCPCEIRLVTPCPHGDAYTCACGHPLVPSNSEAGASGTIGSGDGGDAGFGDRAEAAGIVDQQAVVADEIARSQGDEPGR